MKTEKEGAMRYGKAGLPRHDLPVRNTSSLSELLVELKDRPDTLGLKEIDPASIEIGLKIKRERERRKITQTELAKRAGMEQSTISFIESGKGQDGPTYRVLREIGFALGEATGLSPLGGAVAAVASVLIERAWETLQIIENSDAISLVEETSSIEGVAPLLRAILSEKSREETSEAIEELLRAKTAPRLGEHSFCSYWSLAPHQSGLISAKRGLLVLGVGGEGTIRRRNKPSVPSSNKVAVIPRHARIEIVNTGKEPFGFITMPVTLEIATSI